MALQIGQQYVEIIGSATPANPSAGRQRIFLDTADTKLKARATGGYNVGLQGGSPAYVIAASDASDRSKEIADVVCDGTADDVQINAALTAGYNVMLTEGIFDIVSTINHAEGLWIVGQGEGTILKASADVDVITITAKSNVGVALLKIDTTLTPGTKTTAGIRANGIPHRGYFEKLRILNQGKGIHLTNTLNIFITDVTIEDCASDDILFDGTSGNDHFLTNVTCDHPAVAAAADTACLHLKHTGFLVTDGGGFLRGRHGILADPGAGQTVKWVYIKTTPVDSSVSHGVKLTTDSGGTCWWFWFLGALSNYNGATGVTFKGVQRSCWLGGIIEGNQQHGLVLDDCDYIQVETHITGYSAAGADTYDGVNVPTLCTRIAIVDSLIGSANGRYGINLVAVATDEYRLQENQFYGNASGHINDLATGNTKVVRDNIGYATENKGTATLVNGQTSIAVTHGLAVTPAAGDIMVTPIEAWGAMTEFYVDTYTSTQFTIHADQDPGQDVDFAWKALVV